MEHPRISIVTPSYNQAKYLPDTIESILSQHYPNLEYIIIDGGSTDGSVDIIKRYEPHLSCWISERDGGQSEAINKGFKKATGRLFNWINSDDVLFPGALYHIARAYVKHPEADLIVGVQARGDSEGKIFSISSPPSRFALCPKRFLLAFGQQATFIAADTFRSVGGVRDDLYCIMDTELYYRILVSGGRLVRIRTPIGLIREHSASKGVARSHEWSAETKRIHKEYGISEKCVGWRRKRMRLCRLLDGSYAHSCLLQLRWNGRHPWAHDCYFF